MRLPTLLLTLLVMSTAAAAQEGPAPGYATALAYAGDHVDAQVENASRDPVAYGAAKANASRLGEDAGHAAWLACWAASDAGIEAPPGTCDRFFQQPSTVDPPLEENRTAAGQVNATLDEANATAQEAIDTLQETQEALPGDLELGEAWDALRDAVAAGFGTVQGAAHLVGQTVEAWRDASVTLLTGSLALAGAGMDASVQAYALTGEAVVDGAQASFDGVQWAGIATKDAAVTTGVALGDAARASADAAGEAAGAAADGLQGAAGAAGAAFGDAADTVAEAVGDAASAMAGAVAESWDAVAGAVAGLFGSGAEGADGEGVEGEGVLDGTIDDGDLLDGVTGQVPLL